MRRRIDKSALTFGEPSRLRDKAYCRSANGRACMACGTRDDTVVLAHINLAGTFGLGLKASDDESVFLCGRCHAEFDGDPDRADWLVRSVFLPQRRRAYREWLAAQPIARKRA